MAWTGFIQDKWQKEIDVRNFIRVNYKEYIGDGSFLTTPTSNTIALSNKVNDLIKAEKEAGGVLDIDTERVSSILAYPPAYIDKECEKVVGLQTGSPLCRGINPFGGIRLAAQACAAYGYTLSSDIIDAFKYTTTHNDGVFSAYSEEMLAARKSGIITGLPDAYGRGRIIGDYRRLPLYGMDFLLERKISDKKVLHCLNMTEETIRLIEEVQAQIQSMKELKAMANEYGFDISKPASNAREAVQWLYFAYLGAVKEQNGAAMSLGRVSTFLDIYFERDLSAGLITEAEAQELIDQFVLKLRIIRQLRTPEYNELFAGDPTWVTVAEGGMCDNGRSMVTKTSYRMLNTLYNLGSSAEPNITILWSDLLPSAYKEFCAKVSIDTDSIQYESDDLMRVYHGDDYAISCCVSALTVGKQLQYFGARCNIAKLLLYAINGGRDEISGVQVGPERPVLSENLLDYQVVKDRLDDYIEWLCKLYVKINNLIHYMHDKYNYEKLEMAFHDTILSDRLMAFGIAGLSVLVDSLSAIKYAKVYPILNEAGLVTDFRVEGDFPKYGNDDDRADKIAVMVTDKFMRELECYKLYRRARPTLSLLTITSNVVYGKKTGTTPDGRRKGEPFAPGANPMHHRDTEGVLASLNSVAKIPYAICRDGISYTITMLPKMLGNDMKTRVRNLVSILDGYFNQNGHHLNVNVLDSDTLVKAMEDPLAYPNLTIRVSGYAVNFHALSKEQQLEVIARTIHTKV